jgi:hypothetical protein
MLPGTFPGALPNRFSGRCGSVSGPQDPPGPMHRIRRLRHIPADPPCSFPAGGDSGGKPWGAYEVPLHAYTLGLQKACGRGKALFAANIWTFAQPSWRRSRFLMPTGITDSQNSETAGEFRRRESWQVEGGLHATAHAKLQCLRHTHIYNNNLILHGAGLGLCMV